MKNIQIIYLRLSQQCKKENIYKNYISCYISKILLWKKVIYKFGQFWVDLAAFYANDGKLEFNCLQKILESLLYQFQ